MECLSELDLDIKNYTMNELLNVFHISSNDLNNKNLLRELKKKVLKFHPDNCELDKKYFIFFLEAYNVIKEYYYHKHKELNKEFITDYSLVCVEEVKCVLKNRFGDVCDESFNKWFNVNFSRYNYKVNNDGYGDWLKSDESIYTSHDKEYIDKIKNDICQKNLTDLVCLNNNLYSNTNNNLLYEEVEGINYTNTCGDLKYSDLKQAHLESIIMVSNNDLVNYPKYNDINEYEKIRNKKEYLLPKSRHESLDYLYERDKKEENKSLMIYEKLNNELYLSKDMNDKVLSGLRMLE